MSNIEERVKKIVIEQLGVKEEEVSNSASFVDDLGADSLDTVELVMALEEEFECEIPDEEAEALLDVGRMHAGNRWRRGEQQKPKSHACFNLAPVRPRWPNVMSVATQCGSTCPHRQVIRTACDTQRQWRVQPATGSACRD